MLPSKTLRTSMAKKKKSPKSKYHNVKREYKGLKFDSLAELGRYLQLLTLEKAGLIRLIRTQAKFDLWADDYFSNNATKVAFYRADFVYEMKDGDGWVEVVEDVKGQKSGPAWAMFRIKAKIFAANYGHEIVVIDGNQTRKSVPKNLL
jgi:hypothetical protein|tara:strand:+ start:714 stop:1157 length:444 start_codon:yes stop_codon:yes gene_type:complete